MIKIGTTEPYTVNEKLAVNGYWATCHRCKRECFRSGHNFVACTAHSEYDIGDTSWQRYKVQICTL